MVKNTPCNSGDVGSIPGRVNKIPHVTATEPSCSGACAPNEMELLVKSSNG